MTIRQAARVWPGALAALFLIVAFATALFAQTEQLPPKPDRYITDQAGVLDQGTLDSINNQLEQFERDTSNQFVVAIFQSLPPDAEIASYTTDLYNAWQLGQKGKDNGVLLVVAVKDRKMFIGTNRGLNGALTDALCSRIIRQEIAPRFKENDYAGGIQAGVNAIIAATKGEYTGNGTTVNEREHQQDSQGFPPWIFIIVILAFIGIRTWLGPGSGYRSGPVIFTGGGWGGGGGGFGGGGGGGGGGFSGGGGGSSDGGGAGGSW
jgi:uncharacterized protein